MATSSDYFRWESCKPMPTKRVFSTAVELEDQLFVLGGCDARGVPVDNLESFNPSAKKNPWSRLRNMPTPRAGVSAVAIGGKLLTFGGVNVNQEPVDVVEIYDCRSKQWMSNIETMKERLLGVSSLVKDDKAVVIGGMGYDTNPKDFLMVYHLDSNRWESLPPMTTPRYATFSYLIGDRLYVLGGRQGKVPVTALEAYDFREGKWQTLENIPTKRVFPHYNHDESRLFSVGGLNEDSAKGFSDVTEIFEISSGKWRDGQHMIDKRGDFAAGMIKGNLIVAGGLGNDGKPLNKTEVYDSTLDKWTPLPEMASAHCSCAFTSFRGNLHVIGGLTVGGPSNAMESCLPN